MQPTLRTTKVRISSIKCFLEEVFYNRPFTEEMIGEVTIPPGKKLEDLIRLSELCVDLLRQNEEFYAEVRQPADQPSVHALRSFISSYVLSSLIVRA